MAEYIWPWPKGTQASQEFGTNPGGVNPSGGHTGLDAALPAGTPLRAEADGVVVFEGWANLANNPFLLTDGGGICLAIDFGEGKPMSIKGHLSATFVSYGERVKQGQIVCESGNTGRWTTGPHVHEEFLPPVYSLTSPTYGRVNPRNYCTAYWEDINQPVLPHQRETLTKVWQRTAPEHRNDGNRVKLWDENLVFDFRAWTRGTDPYGDGNDVWFVGAYTDTYFHSSAFKDMGTHDLPEISREQPTPPPVPDPAPVVPDFAHLNGIDVSNHNARADLAVIPADFIWIKASEGVGWVDPELAQNVAEARRNPRSPIIGFYHFARPLVTEGNTAQAEADWFMQCIKPYMQIGDLTSLDWEAENQDRTDWAKEFCDRLKFALGSRSFIYAGTGAINAGNWAEAEAEYPLWYPNYEANEPGPFNPAPAPSHTTWTSGLKIWQYTSRGRLAGYEGDLDLNVFYGTREELMSYGTRPPVIIPPDPNPDPEPAKLPGLDDKIRDLVDYYRE